ncbi:hypothetical protein MNV49_007539 [Pseudohyphozyma bogoriensis]|nr:hypothetical protein MNV49_007539 [Pseudohyphozyma bogoriensis]
MAQPLPTETTMKVLANDAVDHGSDHADEKSSAAADPESQRGAGSVVAKDAPVVQEDRGVSRIDALYLVFGKGWGIYSLWISIGLIAYVYSLSRLTTAYYAQFATSSFGEHTIIGTIGVINSILAGLADLWSRPHALAISIGLYAIGYAMCAGAHNVQTVVAGQVFYTIGNTGITFLNSLLLADITSLQWRGFVDGAVNVPYVLNAFVSGFIVADINGYSANGWRWGYGMFCIILPVAMSPALIVLFVGDYRAQKLNLASISRSEVDAETEQRTTWQNVRYYWTRMNGLGLLLMGFAFAMLLTPITLSTTAKGGYKNPSLIAMLVVGGILFIAWGIWDGYFAPYPFMPKRILNRTFIACVVADFFYYFSSYLVDGYYSSWVYVIVDWSDKNYQYFNNTVTVATCGLAIFFGLGMRYTHSYKMWQIATLALRIIGMGLQYYSTKNASDAVLVISQVIIGVGAAGSIIASYIGVQGSVPHQDMAIATAVLNLWASLGSSISLAIASSVWNREVPGHLEKYLGDQKNATELAEIFGSIYVARLAEPRDLVKKAYMEAVGSLWLAGLITSFGSLIAAFFVKDYYLGQNHNDVEKDKIIKFRDEKEIKEEVREA